MSTYLVNPLTDTVTNGSLVPLSATSLSDSRQSAGAHLNPVFSDDHGENASNEQQRAKRKNQREQQQLAMFLAINGGAKDTVYNHYVHTSQCPQRHKGTGTGKCAGSSTPTEELISRTLGDILLNALKERGVFKDNADQQGSSDDDQIDEDLFPDNENEDDEGEHDDASDDEEEDVEIEERTNEKNEETDTEDSLVDETTDIEDDKDQHPDDQSKDEKEHDAEPEIVESPPALDPAENTPPSSVNIDKIREILRKAFGIDCNCSIIPKVDRTNQTIAKSTDIDGEHGDHDANTVNDPTPIDEPAKTTLFENATTTSTTTAAPVVGQPQKPNHPQPVSTLNEQMLRAIADAAAKLSSISTSMQVVGRRPNAKTQSVENTVNIQVNASKEQRRTDTASPCNKPTRVQLNTGDLPDLTHDTPAATKTTARSVRKSNKAATQPKAEDLQYFRDQRDRSARRAHKRKQAQRPAATAAHGARRVRNEQSAAAAAALAAQSASLDPAIVSALSNVADIASSPALVNVQRRERGAVVRRARRPERRPDERSSGDRAASANHSARGALSAAVKGAATRPDDDSADVLLKRFLGLYERYKRSQDEEAYDDLDDADAYEDDVSEGDEVNESE